MVIPTVKYSDTYGTHCETQWYQWYLLWIQRYLRVVPYILWNTVSATYGTYPAWYSFMYSDTYCMVPILWNTVIPAYSTYVADGHNSPEPAREELVCCEIQWYLCYPQLWNTVTDTYGTYCEIQCYLWYLLWNTAIAMVHTAVKYSDPYGTYW